MQIIQIVPRLPPYTDGVGDYAIALATQLRAEHDIHTHFLSFQLGLTLAPEIAGFPVSSLPAHTVAAFLDSLPPAAAILLHYSNYPYVLKPWQAPHWLPTALAQALKQRSLRLVTMFHELPTLKLKSLRLPNPVQGQVSRRLAQLSQAVVTDSARFQAALSRWSTSEIPCIPDFSTIGEPKTVPPLAQRQRQLVIFGGNDRNRIYQQHRAALIATCQQLQIQEICDVGRDLGLNPNDFGPVQLTQLGFQPAEAVSQLMLNSFAGMIDYSRFPGDLGKSTVFAAFTSHGVLPLSTVYNPSEQDGLFLNQHYLVPGPDLGTLTIETAQAIATRAYHWYTNHSLSKNAAVFAQLLTQSTTN